MILNFFFFFLDHISLIWVIYYEIWVPFISQLVFASVMLLSPPLLLQLLPSLNSNQTRLYVALYNYNKITHYSGWIPLFTVLSVCHCQNPFKFSCMSFLFEVRYYYLFD